MLGLGAACGLLPEAPDRSTNGEPCLAAYSADRCEAIAARAAEQLGVDRTQVSSVDIGPAVTAPPGTMFSGPRPVFLFVRMANGSTLRTLLSCPGIAAAHLPECMSDPHVELSSPLGGYHDRPSKATPLPSGNRSLVGHSTPIVVESRRIAIAGPGHYEIALGDGTLPNGILTQADFGLADPWPDGIRFEENRIRLEVQSLDPSRPPFRNLYEHGWWPGLEKVRAVLVFDVAAATPGAGFTVTGVVVR